MCSSAIAGQVLETPLPGGAAAPAESAHRTQIFLCAFTITLAQVLVACNLSGQATPAQAYRALSQWDSQWYTYIAEHGYPDLLPVDRVDMAKVGFFPGYPLVSRFLARVTGLGTKDAGLLAAQLACWGFWTYVLLFLQRWRVPLPLAVIGVLAILVHPCAFFLVAAYSESLFLLAVLGFLYWSNETGPTAWTLAALHGMLMTATRIVGLPLVVCPVVLTGATLLRSQGAAPAWKRRLASSLLLSAVSSLGGLLFLGFCQLQYGRWDAYMYAQHAGWGVQPDYLAFFRPEIYHFVVPAGIDPNEFSQLSVPLTLFAFGAVLLLDFWLMRARTAEPRAERSVLYFCGALMFYIAVSGLANSGLVSMIRYGFCVHVMLVLAVVHLLAQRPLAWRLPQCAAACALGVVAILSLTLEIVLASRFMHSQWVA